MDQKRWRISGVLPSTMFHQVIKVKAGPWYILSMEMAIKLQNCLGVNCKTWNHVTFGGFLFVNHHVSWDDWDDIIFFNRKRLISQCQLFSMSPKSFLEKKNTHTQKKKNIPKATDLNFTPLTSFIHILSCRQVTSHGHLMDHGPQGLPWACYEIQPPLPDSRFSNQRHSRVLMILKGFSSRSWQREHASNLDRHLPWFTYISFGWTQLWLVTVCFSVLF